MPTSPHYAAIKDIVSDMELDVLKGEKNGNKEAMRRSRKKLQDIREIAKEWRKDLNDNIKAPHK